MTSKDGGSFHAKLKKARADLWERRLQDRATNSEKELCALCRSRPANARSHIIQHSLAEWLMARERTTTLRNSTTPNKPAQSTWSQPLLCTTCDSGFGDAEGAFLQELVQAAHDRAGPLAYSAMAVRGLHVTLWRNLTMYLRAGPDPVRPLLRELAGTAPAAQERWRCELLEKRPMSGMLAMYYLDPDELFPGDPEGLLKIYAGQISCPPLYPPDVVALRVAHLMFIASTDGLTVAADEPLLHAAGGIYSRSTTLSPIAAKMLEWCIRHTARSNQAVSQGQLRMLLEAMNANGTYLRFQDEPFNVPAILARRRWPDGASEEQG